MSFVIPLALAGAEILPEVISAGQTAYSAYQLAKGVKELVEPSAPPPDTKKPSAPPPDIKKVSSEGRGLSIGDLAPLNMMGFARDIVDIGLEAKQAYNKAKEDKRIKDDFDEHYTVGQVDPSKQIEVGPTVRTERITPSISADPKMTGTSLTPAQTRQLMLGDQSVPLQCNAGASEKIGDSLGPLPPNLYGYNVSLLASPYQAMKHNSHSFGNRTMFYSMKGGNNPSPYSQKNNALSVKQTPHNPPDATNPVGLETLNKKSRLIANMTAGEPVGSKIGRVQYKQDLTLNNNDIMTMTAGYDLPKRGLIIK
jgi:hypothetical protein